MAEVDHLHREAVLNQRVKDSSPLGQGAKTVPKADLVFLPAQQASQHSRCVQAVSRNNCPLTARVSNMPTCEVLLCTKRMLMLCTVLTVSLSLILQSNTLSSTSPACRQHDKSQRGLICLMSGRAQLKAGKAPSPRLY